MAVYLLGIDIGTSSCKAALFREDGTVAASGGSDYPVSYPQRGWAEQDPENWWQGVCRAVRNMLSESGIDPSDIAGIGVDGQSWSAVALDREGKVLCPTPIWTDTRCADLCREVTKQIPEEELFGFAGIRHRPVIPGPRFSGTGKTGLRYSVRLTGSFSRTAISYGN